MTFLSKDNIRLRALEPEDLDWLFAIENNELFWEISSTIQPFSKVLLARYIENANQDFYSAKQLRLVILYKEKPVGLLDLFEYEPQDHRAGLGILILPEFESKGIATTAIEIGVNYGFSILQLHQIYVNITADNTRSIALFKKLNFQLVGTKKEWIYTQGTYKDELLFQRINNDY
ncbi:MAG TPA: N-acetyltransferase [Lutibacter sp.]|nr:N-acetyltransferase [Lutibacter sp.]